MQATKSIIAVALFAAAGIASAQNTPTSPSGTGSVSSDQEVRRGVPGVDADVRTGDRGRSAGVPGVDVDVRNPRTNAGDDDTRRMGAAGDRMGADGRMRADRN
ncbi:hypothetical protein WG922_09670 [Ramlibacter sp. AN1015]|uniref:hypothetical protein n=1 Tax=Ramlibacter sp. AN1015 TaxID=3133428 RepID=UPI0030C5D503